MHFDTPSSFFINSENWNRIRSPDETAKILGARSTLNGRTFKSKRAHVLDEMCARFFLTIRKVKIRTTAVTFFTILKEFALIAKSNKETNYLRFLKKSFINCPHSSAITPERRTVLG